MPCTGFSRFLAGEGSAKNSVGFQLIGGFGYSSSLLFQETCRDGRNWECRINFASNTYRVFCFFADNSVVVLTHGLVKKSQKTPKNEIEKAEAYRRDFLRRRDKR